MNGTVVSADVVSVLAHYRQLMAAGHQEMAGDPAALEAAAQRLNGTVRQVDSSQQQLAGIQRTLAQAWQAPSYEGFDRLATGCRQQLTDASSTLGRQHAALQHAATELRAAATRHTGLLAQYDRQAHTLAATPNALAAADQLGRAYLAASTGIRRDLGAALNAIAATLTAPLQAGRRVGSMSLREIDDLLAHPERHSLATLAAAYARRDLLEHQAAHHATGVGTIRGNQSAPGPGRPSDCTEYVVDIMRRAYAAKNREREWTAILREARNRSGGRLKGTELLATMQRRAGWGGVFWAPDPTDPHDGGREHPYAYDVARRTGRYYGIGVDRDDMVVNYTRTHPSGANPADTTGIDRLREVPFGLLTARGGLHMAAVVNGEVYEVHWERPASDPNTIEATSLERFGDPRNPWQSGAIAAPTADLAAAGLQNPDPARPAGRRP